MFSQQQLLAYILSFKYAILFPFAAIDGSIVPLTAGFLWALGYLDPFTTYFLMVFAGLCGDVVYYFIGRSGREMLPLRIRNYLGMTTDKINMIQGYFDKYGVITLVIARVTQAFSAITLITCGIIRMNFKKFLLINFLVTLATTAILFWVGFYFAEVYYRIAAYMNDIITSIFFLGLLIALIYLLLKKDRKNGVIKT